MSKNLHDPFFDALTKHVNEAIIILDDKLRILLFNRYAEKLFSVLETNVIQKSFELVCAQSHVEYFIQPYLSKINNNESINIKPTPLNFDISWHFDLIKHDNTDFYLLMTKGLGENENQNEILKLETLVENMPCNVYWIDKNCIMVGCNQNVLNMLGLTQNEFKGRSYEELSKLCHWPEGLAENLKNDDISVLKTGVPIIAKEDPPLPNSSGGEFNFLTSRVPIKNRNGEIVGIAGISTDVSALKNAKIAAEAGEKAKAEFIANVSHDMRTPLSGIISTAHELEEDNLTEERRKELSAELAESADALLEMFVEILEDVAADHMTESDITLETFDINRLVDRLVKLEKPSLTQKGLKFLTNIDPNIPQYLVSDRRKIHRIALNLVGNAVKFTKHGHVALKIELIEKQNDQIHITLKFNIIDTGIGVPEKDKKRLFERFYKANPSHQTEYKGFGLGLHIAQTYTHLLGGTISFESTEGVGSNFYAVITLKIANKKEIASYNEKLAKKPSLLKINTNMKSDPAIKKIAPTPVKNTETPSLPDAPNVLIIEDNLVLRRTTARLVKKYHLNVIDVEDGKPALELAKTQHFDLVLSDVGLLEMSGIEFTQKLRTFEKENNIAPVPIVGVTAHAANGSDECLSAGMNAVVPKPLTPELLTEILQKFLPSYK